MKKRLLKLFNLVAVLLIMLAATAFTLYGVWHTYDSIVTNNPMVVFGVLFTLLGVFVLWGMVKNFKTLTGRDLLKRKAKDEKAQEND